MKIHIKLYYEYFGLDYCDFVPCTVCGKAYNHIHHINFKGMGGNKNAERIENYIALCYDCHNQAHNHILTKEQLTYLQQLKIESHG